MRLPVLLSALLLAPSAYAVDRIELSAARVDGPDWQLRNARIDWRGDGRLHAETAELRHAALPAAARLSLRCPQFVTSPSIGCDSAQFEATAAGLGQVNATLGLQLTDATRWRLALDKVRAEFGYNSADGRLATEQLRLELEGRAERRAGPIALDLQLRAVSGQAYAEPIFVDLSEHPARAQARLSWMPGSDVEVRELRFEQQGIGTLSILGRLDASAPAVRHRLEIDAAIETAAAASTLYLQPAIAATSLQKTMIGGALRVHAALRDGHLERASLKLADTGLELPGFGVALNGVDGELHWQAQAPAPASVLHWRGGTVGRLPVGAAQLAFKAAGRDFALSAPLHLPLLDGSIEVEQLALTGLGTERLGADFAARIEPIDLRQLCKSLGWPEFSGTLAGRLPGLRLRERRVDIDGTLAAAAFDGQIEIRELTVIDPFGVLPRIAADVRLRHLDLAAVTGAFDFGRITGRLDGDVDDLRLIGWEPVAMKARLYSTPGDRSRHRISQRAIDSISSIGGGPTGLLSRGFMRFFDDFAYDRIGWSCALDNGVCRMDGIGPAKKSNGYVLVKGQGLPRIDVVGYSRQVSWPVFLSQLRSIGKSGPVEVR